MGVEIERKFLVNKGKLKFLPVGTYIKQGFLMNEDGNYIRIRIRQGRAFLTIKGGVDEMTRVEFEYSIPMKDAKYMLGHLCEKPLIEKVRYNISHKDHNWEVDVFEGKNEGLVIAEIELHSQDEQFIRPIWIGKEVTADSRYYNNNLVRYPYVAWQ